LGCRADYAGGSKQWNLGIENRINSRIINVLGPWCRNEQQQQQPRPSIQHRLDRSAAKQASYSTQARWYKLGSGFVLFFSEHSQVGQRSPMIDVTQHLQTCGRRADGSPLTGKSQLGQASLLADWSPSRRIASIAITVLPSTHCHIAMTMASPCRACLVMLRR
jgi:hypothetical protein